jgi:hypothetical protein
MRKEDSYFTGSVVGTERRQTSHQRPCGVGRWQRLSLGAGAAQKRAPHLCSPLLGCCVYLKPGGSRDILDEFFRAAGRKSQAGVCSQKCEGSAL